MFKQQGTTIYFLTLSLSDLRLEELLCITKRLNNDKVFFDGKYSASNDYVEFLVHDHTSDTNKSAESGSEEYQTDELQDNFVAENHEENGFPKPTKLIKFK